jgi:hypothetical protein
VGGTGQNLYRDECSFAPEGGLPLGAWLAEIFSTAEGRKRFFFVNKKKQKKVINLDCAGFKAWSPVQQKFFGYFFSKK